jgi:TetR/AcrR family transcriptional regulator, transcriptional repressor for nem operon
MISTKRPTPLKAPAKRRNDPEGVRSRVLDAAAALFQAQGYHATGMRDVIDKTGLSPGAFHHHFPTKEALAIAVINERVAPAVREAWIDPVRDAAHLRQGVVSVFADIIRGLDDRGKVSGCPLNNLAMELSLTNPRMRDALRNVFVEWQDALETRIARSPRGKQWSKDQRRAAASFIVASYSGAMNLSKAAQDSAPLKTTQKMLSQWMADQQLD